ncbi:alkyl hydroperoxide reductase thiol specific antioxidant mal allergen [Colletotrichum asianum]|uniref:Alkyl hydroperoxide reductase thiol specific antioxidant mal allergen n=1 Tax=Colletotrichum asianum TaxID=702518 RepID=A0A8H3VYZ7_9PEZI|nr:alkyl hydroperoxide reductase thiol specific antioxidant mal allergen [Colletotrichum asianum]
MYDQAVLDEQWAIARGLPPDDRKAAEGIIRLAEMMNAEERQEAEAERRASGDAVATQDANEPLEQMTDEAARAVTNDDDVASHSTASAETAIDGFGAENIGVANAITDNDDLTTGGFDNNTFDIDAFTNDTFADFNSNFESFFPAMDGPDEQTANDATEVTRVVDTTEQDSETASEQLSVPSEVTSPATAQTTPPAPSDSPAMLDAAKPASAPATQLRDREYPWQNTTGIWPPWTPSGILVQSPRLPPPQAVFHGASSHTQRLPRRFQSVRAAPTPIVARTSVGKYPRPHRPLPRRTPSPRAVHSTFKQFPSGRMTTMNNASASMPATIIPNSVPFGMATTTLSGMPNTQQWMNGRAVNTIQTGHAPPGLNTFNDASYMAQYGTQPAALLSQGQTQQTQLSTAGFEQPPISVTLFQCQMLQRQLEQQQMQLEAMIMGQVRGEYRSSSSNLIQLYIMSALASSLPSNLPPPVDDGACDHLPGLALPSIPLPTASDPSTKIDVSTLPGLVLIFVYPRSASPGEVIPPEWDAIPGARGCTPQACSYRDNAARLAGAGVAHLFGVSAQTAEVQREFREREHLPYELLSDAGLEMARGLGLPTFDISSTDDDVSEHTSIRDDNDTVKTAADVPVNTAVSPTDEKADATTSATAEPSAEAAEDTTGACRDLADDNASVAAASIATTPIDAGLPEYLEETLEDDVNVPSLWFPHSTPLHIAIQKGRVKICERLISAGADINARDDEGVQPLHTACCYGNSDLIRLLLDKKAGITGPDSDGWCLLHYASYYDLEPALLDRLIEVDREYLNNKERFEGWTPVSRATWFGRESVVDALLKAGVDLDIPDNANRTPMIMAIKEQYFSILDKMVNHLALVRSDDLPERAIDHRDGEGMTVLMTLCAAEPSSASVESLRNFLTKLRPNPDITDNINQTALDHAMIMAKTFNTFDDAFDKESRPLLDAMVNRLKEDVPLRDQLLRWLALREGRHATAIDILSELDAHDSIDLLQSRDEWTLVDWAIYHRMPRVLLNCPALDDRGRKRGTEIIEQLKQIYPAQEKKRNTDRKDELTERQVLNAMVGVLNFLPRVPKKYWKISKRTPEMTRCSKHFNAAAVRFHLLDLEALTFQKVDELVYGDSPIKLTTIDQIQQFATGTKTSTESTRISPPTESAFTWVHLPATNMEWMKDTAVKIMRSQSQNEISDQEKLSSFLQASWVQIPDKTSPSRFMRPRYVRMQAEDVSVPETNAVQSDHAPEDNVGSPPGPVPQDDKKMKSSNSLHCPASALYMPFLVVGQYDHEKEHTQHDGTPEATSFPRPQSMEQPERAFQRQDLFSAYKTSVLHDSPTLDEHYYHFAEDKDSARDRLDRNETQVITKYLSPGSKVGGKRQKPQKPQTILRVSQLWAWTIGDKWLITSTSCAKVDEKSTFVAEIREHLLRRADDGSLNGGIHSPQELSKVIAEYCIGACERKQELEKQISEPIRDDQSDPASAKTKVSAGKAAHN